LIGGFWKPKQPLTDFVSLTAHMEEQCRAFDKQTIKNEQRKQKLSGLYERFEPGIYSNPGIVKSKLFCVSGLCSWQLKEFH
jgi:hypothetical protein